jgi:benzoate membrane transport protein
VSMQTQLGLAMAMFVTYLCGRRLFPRYAVIATLLVGIAIAGAIGLLHVEGVRLQWARPVFTTPSLSLASLFGIALPLFIVTMTSQNVPGVAVIRASGYDVPISPVIGWTGVMNTLLAPFGAFALNLAAITAAICMGREAHLDPQRRYVASVFAGIFYVIVGATANRR